MMMLMLYVMLTNSDSCLVRYFLGDEK